MVTVVKKAGTELNCADTGAARRGIPLGCPLSPLLGAFFLGELEMSDAESCILGQTDTDFFSHAFKLDLDDWDCDYFGFIDHLRKHDYPALTREWKKQLRK